MFCFDASSEVDFYHVASYSETVLLEAIEVAVTNANPWEHARLYEFLLAAFVFDIDASAEVDFYHVANCSGCAFLKAFEVTVTINKS